MLNSDESKRFDVQSDRSKRQQSEQQGTQSQWAQMVGQVMEKVVSGTNMTTTIAFDNLEIDVPKARGPDGRDLGGATWKLNGKIVWTTDAHKSQSG
jgi:hypothetical protein